MCVQFKEEGICKENNVLDKVLCGDTNWTDRTKVPGGLGGEIKFEIMSLRDKDSRGQFWVEEWRYRFRFRFRWGCKLEGWSSKVPVVLGGGDKKEKNLSERV